MGLLPDRLVMAMRAAFYIAYNGRQDRPVTSADIVEHYDLKERALEPVLQRLSSEGIIVSIKGPKGGYYVPDPVNTSLKDIVECFFETAIDGEENEHPDAFDRILFEQVEAGFEKWLGIQSATSLQYLCNEARKRHIPTIESPPPLDFVV